MAWTLRGFGQWVVACLLLATWAAPSANAGLADPLVLTDIAKGIPVKNLAYLPDPQSMLTIQDIRTQRVASQFVPTEGAPRFAGGSGPVWFAIRLSQLEFDGDWLIAVPASTLQDLQFYGPFDSNGREHQEPVLTGSLQPYPLRPLGNESFVMPVRLQLPGDYTVYVRATSSIARAYGFKVWDVASYYSRDQTRRLFDGLCYGVMLGLLIYNLALWVTLRDRTYGLYVLQGVFALLSIATFNGHVARYFLPDWPVLADRLNVVMPALWIATAAVFAHNFLSLSRFAPRLGWVVYLAALASLGTAALGGLGVHTLGQSLNENVSIISTVFVVAAASVAWFRGFTPARLYLLGQGVLFIAVYSTVAANWGWIPRTVFVDASLQLGVSLEFMIFALALSSRIRVLQDIQIELTRKAVALTQASETDPLTRVANRAGLASKSRELLVNARQRTLIMIDLDKFKPINDVHGHAAGDAMLVEIARRLVAQVRPSDVVARLGGDEFVILLSEPNDRASLEGICKRILGAMVQPLPFDGRSLAVGGSLGLARYPADGNSLDDLLQAADVAMYHIKKNGRANFAFFEDLTGEDAQEASQSVARSSANADDAVLF